jgi:hypothetical protein
MQTGRKTMDDETEGTTRKDEIRQDVTATNRHGQHRQRCRNEMPTSSRIDFLPAACRMFISNGFSVVSISYGCSIHQGTPHGQYPPRPAAGFLLVLHTTCALALEKPAGPPIVTITGLIAEKNRGADAQFDSAMLDKLPQVKMTVPTLGTNRKKPLKARYSAMCSRQRAAGAANSMWLP